MAHMWLLLWVAWSTVFLQAAVQSNPEIDGCKSKHLPLDFVLAPGLSSKYSMLIFVLQLHHPEAQMESFFDACVDDCAQRSLC